MAEDLSHTVPGLTPSSQAATNTTSTNAAMTAPGTASESTAHEQAGDPLTSEHGAARTDGRQLAHGEPDGHAAGAWVNVSGRRAAWGP